MQECALKSELKKLEKTQIKPKNIIRHLVEQIKIPDKIQVVTIYF